MEKQFKFCLGCNVRNKIDGFEGIIMAQIRNATGCLQYLVYGRNTGSENRAWTDEALWEKIPNTKPMKFV
jgi:quinol monooxygenase YgiN